MYLVARIFRTSVCSLRILIYFSRHGSLFGDFCCRQAAASNLWTASDGRCVADRRPPAATPLMSNAGSTPTNQRRHCARSRQLTVRTALTRSCSTPLLSTPQPPLRASDTSIPLVHLFLQRQWRPTAPTAVWRSRISVGLLCPPRRARLSVRARPRQACLTHLLLPLSRTIVAAPRLPIQTLFRWESMGFWMGTDGPAKPIGASFRWDSDGLSDGSFQPIA